ncbi:hypothetical protein DIS24_g12351 [Lasiodiplodia hormozganensis]|uniref:Uncharacterized protein n=1 Tax=Lasiodiplodia hormozganensis TaxID=869390 RepID=A0AA39TZV7_9PEZI|nr:Ribonuclease [Lasiodiplodia theobromae]KAF4534180.1 Ribonuclease [Lasiodiplodia theobromae]KAK0609288.1 hypothetical protein DIS24_g12351 [Lasiodiplodia hormozganensis]
MSFWGQLDEVIRRVTKQEPVVSVGRSGALNPSRQGGFSGQVHGHELPVTRNTLDPTLVEEYDITPVRVLELWNDGERQLAALNYKGWHIHPDHFDIVAKDTAKRLAKRPLYSEERIFSAISIKKLQKQAFDQNELHNRDATVDMGDEADAPGSPVEDIPRPVEATKGVYLDLTDGINGRLNEKQPCNMSGLYGSFTTVADVDDDSHSSPNRSLDGEVDAADSASDCNLDCEVDALGSPVSEIPQPVQATKGVCLDPMDGSNQSDDRAGGAMALTADSNRPALPSSPLRSLRTRHRDKAAGVTLQEERSSGGSIGGKVPKKRKGDGVESYGQKDAHKLRKVAE